MLNNYDRSKIDSNLLFRLCELKIIIRENPLIVIHLCSKSSLDSLMIHFCQMFSVSVVFLYFFSIYILLYSQQSMISINNSMFRYKQSFVSVQIAGLCSRLTVATVEESI
jgi:hypothetical protein